MPAAQSQAIERYLTLVRRGTLDTSALANPEKAGATTPTELEIAPLSVEALALPGDEYGSGSGVDRRGPR